MNVGELRFMDVSCFVYLKFDAMFSCLKYIDWKNMLGTSGPVYVAKNKILGVFELL